MHWVRGFGHASFPTAPVLRGQTLLELAPSFVLSIFGDGLPGLVEGSPFFFSFFAGVFGERAVELPVVLLLLVLKLFVPVVSLPLATTFSLNGLSTRLLLALEATTTFLLSTLLFLLSPTPSAFVRRCPFETSRCVGLVPAAAAPFSRSLCSSFSGVSLLLVCLVRSESLVLALLRMCRSQKHRVGLSG